MSSDTLLTIAIPTYNRHENLEVLLLSIISQLEKSLENKIEVIICDNASTDDTALVADRLLSKIKNSNYYSSEINVGMDLNFKKCFDLASSKYFWMIGDDDYLLPGALPTVIRLLEKNESIDLVYVSSTIREDLRDNEKNNNIIYTASKDEFIDKVGIMITFISGVISNKEKYLTYRNNRNDESFVGIFLMHLSWQFSLLKEGEWFAIIKDNIIKATPDNSGGYKIFTVFSKNLTIILDLFFKRESFFSKKIRFSSMLFLINFIGKPEKKKNHKSEDYISVCDFTYNDIPIYTFFFKYLYKYPVLAKLYCAIKDTVKVFLKFIKKLSNSKQ
ncbi:putative glycosyl transferase [Pragia fontium]|uniref:glycosyltransferase family 2 protein n=1 Tax=Pragia fontium TaxID=82985 RepID=UPI000DFCBC1F|nr:glycosyltransferase family 2 protein [Pragia fontium]SUB83279.1 putative glycosyl transferase [Pragia fontium]